ncbi:hypothetical protein GOQ04_14930 [Emticicia sp. ODNR4P]|nr:hypothetical protein [Emticicia sp. ODNR4P]
MENLTPLSPNEISMMFIVFGGLIGAFIGATAGFAVAIFYTSNKINSQINERS